jgi:probable HAF family extracellular repeat protein
MSIYTYTALNDPSATTDTFVYGINDGGQIVGGYDHIAGPVSAHGFLYSGGTYTTLDDPFAIEGTQLNSINDAGQIVGYYEDNQGGGFHAFQYINGTYFPISDPLASATLAGGINDLGQIVGQYIDFDGEFHGFFYSGGLAGAYTTLDDPSHSQLGATVATGINNAGQIVGYYDNASGRHGFLAIPNGHGGYGYTTLDDPLAASGGPTIATGINNAGEIVGWYFNSTGDHGFLYSGGTYTSFDDPLAPGSTLAYGINDGGQIVGYYDAGGNHGFLLTITPNPPPPAGTTADMILRHGADGSYEIYDIGNNAILSGNSLGQVGTDWQFAGLGGFFSSDTTDMMLRSASTGGFEVYDIANNNITNAAFLGNVGMNWQCGERPRRRRAAEQREELASP